MGFIDRYILYFFIAACTYAILHYLRKKKNKPLLPPGPGYFSTIRTLFLSGNNTYPILANFPKIHGPIATLKLGRITTIIISSSEMAKEVVQQNSEALSGRFILSTLTGLVNYESAIPWLSKIDPWVKVRKLSKGEIFSTKRLDELQAQRFLVLDEMVQTVLDSCKKGESMSIRMLVFGTKFNMISRTLFSMGKLNLGSKDMEEMKETIDGIARFTTKPNVGDYFPLLRPFDLQGLRRNMRLYYDHLYEFLDGVIDERKKERESGFLKNGDFLDVLLDNCLPNRNEEFLSLNDVKLVLTELMVAGTKTITSTVEWAMVELLKNPAFMAKARDELANKIKVGENIKENDMSRFPYLVAIIKETMRLHTMALLLLPHNTEKDIKINGYTIPKDSQILVNSWYMSRDAKHWDEPNKFIPERFIMNSNVDFIGNQFWFMPFGAGRRVCAGMPIALRMIFLILATLIHKFDWKVPEGKTPEDMIMENKYGLSICPKLI